MTLNDVLQSVCDPWEGVDWQGYLSALLRQSTVTEPLYTNIEDRLMYPITEDCAVWLAGWLKQNERNRIEAGDNYNQTDIQDKLNEIDSPF